MPPIQFFPAFDTSRVPRHSVHSHKQDPGYINIRHNVSILVDVLRVKLFKFRSVIVSKKKDSFPLSVLTHKKLFHSVFARLEAAFQVGETKFSLAFYNQSVKV